MPTTVTLPEPVAEILAVENRKTPREFVPLPYEVPLTVREPEMVETFELSIWMPRASLVPHAAVPVIVTLPAPVVEMLEEKLETPRLLIPVAYEVPFTLRSPVFVLTFDELVKQTPHA